MNREKIIKIREYPEWGTAAANWFHEKWRVVPSESYLESIEQSFENKNVIPQWYIAISGAKIVGGLGVIENDFHSRKDLTPNICALYVEKEYRRQGIAGRLLEYVCCDMREKKINTLYLITEHTCFYERYGWEFLCMVQSEGEEMRMYIHREK